MRCQLLSTCALCASLPSCPAARPAPRLVQGAPHPPAAGLMHGGQAPGAARCPLRGEVLRSITHCLQPLTASNMHGAAPPLSTMAQCSLKGALPRPAPAADAAAAHRCAHAPAHLPGQLCAQGGAQCDCVRHVQKGFTLPVVWNLPLACLPAYPSTSAHTPDCWIQLCCIACAAATCARRRWCPCCSP